MRALVLALPLSLLMASPTASAPEVSSVVSPKGWRIHTIEFDGESDDSPQFSLGPSCAARLALYGGSGSVSLYQIPTEGAAASSGSLVGSFDGLSTSTTTFRPGQRHAKAVGASEGSVMEVWCSNVDIATSIGSGQSSSPAAPSPEPSSNNWDAGEWDTAEWGA